MAIGRLSVGVGPKGKAGPHAMYIAREGKYAKHNEKIEKLEATGSGNMPDWAQADPNFFWKMSDEHERKNGTSYREHVISLPRELTPEQRHELIKEWIEQEIGEKHAYQYAIHNPLALDGGEQPHAHIMFSERLRDGIERDPDTYFKRYNSKNPERGGGKKANEPKLADERKLELKEQRDRWEKLCNQHLELAGSDARISMKTLKEQGIDREPVNLSMQQIKRADVEEIYTDLLTATAKFNNAKLDGQAINIVAELSATNEKYEKYHEQADRAINTASDAINYSQSIIEDRERRIVWSSKKHQRYQQRIESSTKRISISEQLVINTKQRVNDSKQLITSSSEQLDKIIRELEQQRLAAERKQLEQQSAEKAAERQRIEKRKPSDLLNKLGARVQIVDADRYGNITTTYKDTTAIISANLHKLIKNGIAKNKEIVITNRDYRGEQINPEYAQNNTAKAFERFMLQKNVLNDPRILIDFGLGKESLGIRDFAEKYNIKCDFHDLQKLDALNPVAEPQLTVEKPTQPKAEQKPQVDSSYDNSPNYP